MPTAKMYVLSGRNLEALRKPRGTVISSAGLAESKMEPCLKEILRKEVSQIPDSVI